MNAEPDGALESAGERRAPSLVRVLIVGCAALFVAAIGIAVALYLHLHARRAETTLVVALPSCKNGVFISSRKAPAPPGRAETSGAPPVSVDTTGTAQVETKGTGTVYLDDQGNPLPSETVTLDDVFDTLGREQCENAKGLDGTAVFSANTLTVQLHNPNPYALKGARIRFEFEWRDGAKTQRDYEFQGVVAGLSDGSFTKETNLNSTSARSMHATISSLYFETPK